MIERTPPKLVKWPFLLSDLLLLALAAWIAFRHEPSIGLWSMAICLIAVALGAWLCAMPFLREYAAMLAFAEADTLATTVAKIQDLEVIRSQIADATAHWQAIQEQAGKTVQGAREVSDRMSMQAQEFQAFLQRANDQEKNTLRFELDKMKRAEAEWLQVVVRILDYVFALHQAGVRTGQSELINELTQFQNACRDAARRVGLVPFVPAPSESFDPRLHQTSDSEKQVSPEASIAEALAAGFTFQTQLLRRALVRVAVPAEDNIAASINSAPSPSVSEEMRPAGEGVDLQI